MTSKPEEFCFVIMGFGTKTCPETGRKIDLDKTFTNIISPALDKVGMRVIRSDKIMHSGTIDTVMYQALFQADLVIADISTANANAIYELGVRHALRRNATIIMKEDKGKFHFDLDHTSTFIYTHLGEDIGFTEATRAQDALATLIEKSLSSTNPDSPVYTYLPNLRVPVLTEAQIDDLLDKEEKRSAEYSKLIDTADTCIKEDDFINAIKVLKKLKDISPNTTDVTQKLALVTYKSKEPSESTSLTEAWAIISQLNPENSNDPETTGLAGAIQKRLWKVSEDINHLDLAIKYYQRGFEIRKDYYNGENLAICFLFKSETLDELSEKNYYLIAAKKIFERIIQICSDVIDEYEEGQSGELKWVYASIANSYLYIGDAKQALSFEGLFLANVKSDWEIETYNETKQFIKKILSNLSHIK